MNILPVNLPAMVPALDPLKVTGSDAFNKVFSDAVAKVGGFQNVAKASVDRLLSGEGEEIHQVALKAQQAELSFELFMQMRNKVISAYQEVMRMQV